MVCKKNHFLRFFMKFEQYKREYSLIPYWSQLRRARHLRLSHDRNKRRSSRWYYEHKPVRPEPLVRFNSALLERTEWVFDNETEMNAFLDSFRQPVFEFINGGTLYKAYVALGSVGYTVHVRYWFTLPFCVVV